MVSPLPPELSGVATAPTVEEFARAWGITAALDPPPDRPTVAPLTRSADTDAFNARLLEALAEFDPSEKTSEPGVFTLQVCPFSEKHSPGAGLDGAAVAVIGAPGFDMPWFRCHHGTHGPVDHFPQLLERIDPLNIGLRLEYMRLRCAAEFDQVDVQLTPNGTLSVPGRDDIQLNLPLTIDEMLDRLVYIASEAAVIDLTRKGDPMPVDAARNLFASSMDRIIGPRGGISTEPRFKQWLAHSKRKTAWAMTWYPGQPVLFKLEHHSELTAGVQYYNLWRPKDLPTAPTDWQQEVLPIRAHIEYLVPNSVLRETFLDWLAHAAQYPAERPHTHFLMISEGGAQGIGRGFLGDLLNAAFAGVKRASISDIIDTTFNEVFFESLFVVVDEAEEREMIARAAAVRHLKDSTTKKSGIVNPKYGKKRVELLFSRILAFSNSMQSLPIDIKDRRWNVILNPRLPKEEAYYTQLYGLLKQPRVLASFVAFLTTRDISRYNPFAPAIMTETKRDLLEHTTSELVLSLMKVKKHYTPDLIIASELQEALMGPALSQKQNTADAYALRRGCDEADITNYTSDQIRFDGRFVRVRILRNHGKWNSASVDEVRAALTVLDAKARIAYLVDAKNEVSHPVGVADLLR